MIGSPPPMSGTVADIMIPVPSITPDTVGSVVFTAMTQNRDWPTMGVVNEAGRIVGMLSRHAFIAIMAKPLMSDLYAKRPVEAIMRTNPLIADVTDSIESCVDALVAGDPEALFEGFVIADGGRYRGVASAQDLLSRSTANARRAAEENRLKSERIAAMLNTALEGFLSIGADLLIEEDFSRPCAEMLGDDLRGRDVTRVLFGDDEAKRQILERGLSRLFVETDPARRAMFLSLLPTRATHGARVIDLRYAPINQDRVMLVLSDVSESLALEEAVAREHKNLEIVVHAAIDSQDFFAAVNEIREFLVKVEAVTRPERSPLMDIEPLYRAVHTFKGTFAQYGFYELPKALHQLESSLSALGEEDSRAPDEIRTAAFDAISLARLGHCLKKDLRTVADLLGDEFLDQQGVAQIPAIHARKLRVLAETILANNHLPSVAEEFIPALRSLANLTKISLLDALRGYAPLVSSVAEREGKLVRPLIVNGEDVWLDRDVYGPFLRTLGHLFRNAVAHGVETPETRGEQGKAETGMIRCVVQLAGDQARIVIADDGQGIDEERLAAKLAAEFGAAEVAGLAREQLWDMIFRDGMTTRDEADDLSGRGVGLSAVRAAVEALGGSITVHSDPGQGTKFTVTLPIAA